LEDETPEGSCPVTRSLKGDKGLGFFRLCCDDGRSLRQLGVMMAWLVSQGTPVDGAGGVLTPLSCILPPMVFQGAGLAAVHRTLKKGALPLRLGGLEALIVRLKGCTYQDILAPSFSLQHSTESWMLLSLLYINWMHGCRGAPRGRWRKSDETALFNVQASVERILRKDTEITRSAAQVEKELSNRFVTYTGEEVAKMEPLTFDQVFPALPPMGHGGSIPILEWTKGRTRTFLNRPSDCVASDCGQKLPKLQAKVHIVETDRMKVAALLVSRNICSWVELDSVFKYRGTTVLNGMFGVAKSATLDDSRPHLRVIMNLIPSNSVMEQLTGCVHELPGITQYMSITLGPDETLRLCQSDMTSAFYLFALPPQWRPYLAFNLVVDGADIGRVVGTQYALACGVLPMGWASAVSVMQEASQLLLDRHGLPRDAMVTRTRPLPSWLTAVLGESRERQKAWYHVYLDNFFAGEKVLQGEEAAEVAQVHAEAEKAWNTAGVISSAKKKVHNVEAVEELGALLDGDAQLLGGSAERLHRLILTTCLLLSMSRMPTKWLQVVMGRWVHILQFRRAGMAGVQMVWKLISGKRMGPGQVLEARRELLYLVFGACLFHTNLGARVSEVATASDASGRGGAVGQATGLSSAGQAFSRSLGSSAGGGIDVPILVISLFNGIGGAFRAYDLVGASPSALIAFDISKAACRVTSRRWPHAVVMGDVRKIDRKMVHQWLLRYPHVQQVDLWGGFPCVDLSSVKYNRKNLEGEESGLFSEILRVLELLLQVFGRNFPIYFFCGKRGLHG